MSISKNLIILRHGQAKNAGVGEMDSSRPLTLKGRQDAQNAGQFLVNKGFVPDYVFCSPTIRTRETLAEVEKSFPSPVATEYVSKIYHSCDRDLLNLLATTPEHVGNLLLIGHNPAIHQLAIVLAKSGEQELIDRACLQFSPCTMAVLSLDGAWSNIKKTNGKLLFLSIPVTTEV